MTYTFIESRPINEGQYIANHYGTCDMGNRCYSDGHCLKEGTPMKGGPSGWLGTSCSHWTPVEERSFEDMLTRLKEKLP